MTGRERSTRGKLGAVFFAVVMVTSMVAVGIGGLAGTAAAGTASQLSVSTTEPVQPSESVTLEFDVSNTDDVAIYVKDTDDNSDTSSDDRVTDPVFQPSSSGTVTTTITPSDSDAVSTTDDKTVTVYIVQEGNSDGSIDSDGTSVDSTDNTDDSVSLEVDGDVPDEGSITTLDTDDDGNVDTANVVIDEPVLDSSLSASDWSIGGTTADSISTNTFNDDGTTADTDTDNDRFSVSLNDGNEIDGTGAADVVYSGTSVTDLAGNQLADVDTADVAETDGASPVLLSATASASSSTGTAEFSEAVEAHDGGEPENDDLQLTDVSGDGVTAINTVTDSDTPSSQVTLGFDNTVLNSDINADTVNVNTGSNPIEDTADNDAEAGTLTLTTSSLAGGGDGTVSYEIAGGNAESVITGSADNELSGISIQDRAGGEFRGTVDLSFGPAVTVNESASTLNSNTVVSSSSDLNIDSVNVINSSHTVEIDVSGTSSAGEQIDIASGALHVAVDGSQVDTTTNPKELPATIETFGNTLKIRDDSTAGDTNGEGFLDASGFTISDAGDKTLSADSTQNSLTNDITIDDVDQNEIGDGTAIVLSVESGTGITFDQSVDPTSSSSPVIDADGDFDIDGTDNEELDVANATLTQTSLTVPINDSIDADDVNTIDINTADNVKFNVSGGASQNAHLNVSVAAASPNTGSYQLGSLASGSKDPTFSDEISVDIPSMTFNSQNAPVGADQTDLNQLQITIPADYTVSSKTYLNITTNNSAVTFDESLNGNDAISVSDIQSNGELNDDFQNVTVKENVLALGKDADDDSDVTYQIDGSKLGINVSTSAADESKAQFNATNGQVQFSDSSNLLTLERPNTQVEGGQNATVDVDADGESNAEVGSNQFDTTNALTIDSDDVGGQIAANTYVNVTLESGTGVTFDQSVTGTERSEDAGATGDNAEIDVSDTGADGDDINNVTVASEDTLAIGIADNGGLGQDDTIEVDQLFVNATSDASNTTLSVTTNTGDNTVTTDFENIIATNTVEPSSVFADANTDEDIGGGTANEPEYGDGSAGSGPATDDNNGADNPTVDETIPSSIYVEDGGSAFGGADVELEIVKTPEGASGASLNTTALTTNSNGIADYEFTVGDTDGTYVVNASTDSGSLNVTYEAVPGDVASVTVTPIENAIVGGSNDLDQASLYVNATDANGNPVNANPTVDVTADNVGASEIGAFNEKDPDGSHNDVDSGTVDDTLDDGSFTIDDVNNDGSSVIEVNSDQVEDVTVTVSYQGNSDSGTVTFYDSVGQVDLALNQSTAAVDETVSADATISETDGTTIEVPDVTVNYDDNSDGNTTFEGGADSDSATTNDAGVASVNVTAEQNGTSTIDATSNLRSASATLDIGGQPDTGSPLDGTAGEYDSDGDGQVTASELGNAVTAFGEGDLTASELGDVVTAFGQS